MDPLTLGITAVSMGMQLFGGMGAAENAREAHRLQGEVAGLEGKVNDQRRSQMELSARRQQMEIFRNNQRARAMGTNAAVNQGAQFGSGLQGGLAQVQNQSMWNSLGISQNLEIGRNIFGINDEISRKKAQISNVQGEMATNQGIASFGGQLMNSAEPISRISRYGFGGGGGGINLSGIGFNPIRGASGSVA